MYTHERMVEAALEQYERPQSRLLVGYGIADGTQQGERLIKPTTFTTIENLELNMPGGRCWLNLDDTPDLYMNRRDTCSNQPQQAQGCSRLLPNNHARFFPQTPTTS